MTGAMFGNLYAVYFTGNAFRVLWMQALLGRYFMPSDAPDPAGPAAGCGPELQLLAAPNLQQRSKALPERKSSLSTRTTQSWGSATAFYVDGRRVYLTA